MVTSTGSTEASHFAADQAASSHRELIDQTARFSQMFLRWIDGPGGLTYARLRILERLHCQGPAMMSELANDAGITRRNLTSLADALEHEGLIRRVAHPDDRRATLIELTQSGWDAAEQSLARRFSEIANLFESLSPTQRKQLGQNLASLTSAMAASPCSEHAVVE